MTTASAPRRRTAGRVILLDPDGAVLLVHERERAGGGTTRWLTPGGGVEAHETPAQAAVRETLEEAGLAVTLTSRTDPVLVETTNWWLGDELWEQTNHYFLARTEQRRPPVAPTCLTDLEQSVVLGARWWDPAELFSTEETVWPPSLAHIVATAAGS
ncbi:MAG: mismatch repair protein MutT [Frankiales bacterium]|nr:mismatch repair protein MutT [Frankiales bacterium]